MTSMIAMRRWLSAVVRMRSTPWADTMTAVEGAVAADADQAFDPDLPETGVDEVELRFVVGVDIVARGADQRAALGGIELGDGLVERVEEHVGDAGVEEAVEALDEADD